MVRKETARLASNVLSLSILQFANYVLPLISIPYLTRVVGPEKFGILSIALSVVVFLSLIVNYGFNLSATRFVSLNRYSNYKLSEIYFSVILLKIFFFILCFFPLMIIIHVVDGYKEYANIFLLTYLMLLGQALLPQWLFHGMEKMRPYVIFDLCAKLIFTVCIFIFIKTEDDFYLAPMFTSIGYLISGFIGAIYAFFLFDLKILVPKLKNFNKYLRDGFELFVSSFSTGSYTSLVPFVLSFFASNQEVGFYAAVSRLIQAVKQSFNPISQAFFPHLAKTISKEKERGLKFLLKIGFISSFIWFLISVFIFIYSEQIITIIFGNSFSGSIIILKIMSFIPFIVVISNMLGVQLFINVGLKSLFMKIILFVSLFSLIMVAILTSEYRGIGAGLSVLISELLITTLLIIYTCLRWNKIKK